MKTKPDVAVYYFPNYHSDARNRAQHGAHWTEWELVRRAEPRFEGHVQPRLPAWGETDDGARRYKVGRITIKAEDFPGQYFPVEPIEAHHQVPHDRPDA